MSVGKVTDMQRSIDGEVIYSTFDELPSNHIKVAEMVLSRAQRLVEHKRCGDPFGQHHEACKSLYLTIPPTGRTLSGVWIREHCTNPNGFERLGILKKGSLTILATALIDTGSRMDDVIFEEFKGTGNMELHLDRKLSERDFPCHQSEQIRHPERRALLNQKDWRRSGISDGRWQTIRLRK